MAVRQIQFPIVYKQNQNAESSGYGKYYPYAWKPDTLTLRGLIERVAMDQSVYSRDIVEGVIQRLTKVMVELLQAGQPVKWDGLGTFTPKIESVKGGVTEAQLKAGSVNVRDAIEGVHIRFIPENEKGEELTSRRMKDAITFTVEGVKILTIDGYAFKDLNRNDSLDAYEDWRLSPQERAADLASQLSIEEIAGLMLYSSHQAVPMIPTMGFGVSTYNDGKAYEESGAKASDLSDDQKKFLKDDHLRAVLVTRVETPAIAAEWNNNMQAFVEGLDHGIPANTSSSSRGKGHDRI